MSELFWSVFNLGITAGWLVLPVLLLRALLKKAPANLRCLSWGLVGLRLMWPFSLESMLSLMPRHAPLSTETIGDLNEVFDAAPEMVEAVVIPVAQAVLSEGSDPFRSMKQVGTWIWLAGMAALVLYTIISTLRLRRRVAVSMPLAEDVRLCDSIGTPFLLGILDPVIYLPSDLPEERRGPVLAHERAHLARGDHWWKPLGFALLTIYWFQPLLWVGYVLFCRDLELACDERVVRTMEEEQRRDYSAALLECSLPRKKIAPCPLAFGEGDVARRIRAVMNYRKPAFWLTATALLAVVILAFALLTDPVNAARIAWEGTLYEVVNETVTELPAGAIQAGSLKSVLPQEKWPVQHAQATGLDVKYSGCPVYLYGKTLYVQDYGGFYLQFRDTQQAIVTAVDPDDDPDHSTRLRAYFDLYYPDTQPLLLVSAPRNAANALGMVLYTAENQYRLSFVFEGGKNDSWDMPAGVPYDPQDPARVAAVANRRALVVGPTYWEMELFERLDGSYAFGCTSSTVYTLMEVLDTRPLSEWQSRYAEEYYRLLLLGQSAMEDIVQQFVRYEPPQAEAKWAWLSRHLGEEAQFESPYEGAVAAFAQWRDYVLMIYERNGMEFLQQTMPKSAELLPDLLKD